jgi:cyclase
MNIRRTLVSIPALCAAWPLAAQQDMSQVKIEAQKISDGIYMLTGSGGNVGVSVGDDGVAIIDDQYPPLAPKIMAALQKLSEKPVKFVVNTHWHGDHTGGNEAFGKAGSIIVAHGNVRRRMSVEQVSGVFVKIPASPVMALPIVTFDRAVTLHWNGEDLEVIHVPNAHTDGDAIIRFRKSNVVHMGDIFFNYWYPFIDTGSGGSVNGVVSAVDAVLASIDDKTKIIPGHGEVATRADLVTYRDMLVTVRDRITKLIEEGRTREEVVAAKPSREFDAKWGDKFLKPDQWVGLLYDDLRKSG